MNAYIKMVLMMAGAWIMRLSLSAHPMPNSFISLHLQENRVLMEVQLPVPELELALKKDLGSSGRRLLELHGAEIRAYLKQHIRFVSAAGREQACELGALRIESIRNPLNGAYQELVFEVLAAGDDSFSVRDFSLHYDVIIHQVANHFAVVKMAADFENAITPEDSVEVGVIQLDIASNTIKPFRIRVEEGSVWRGFVKMVSLGMSHIREGTDHLMFLLLLVLLAPLRVEQKRWLALESVSQILKRVLLLVSAFTLGHTLSLVACTFYPLTRLSAYIEIAIAGTICITALHALYPLFYRREIYITLFFGLIHGAAFAFTLNSFHLSASQTLLSLLGFNLGIEGMQLLLVLLLSPLFYLSRFPFYPYIRIAGGILGLILGLVWIAGRMAL